MYLPTTSIASAGYGSVMNCEKNFQFLAWSTAPPGGGWSPAKISTQLPDRTETSGLPSESTDASRFVASSGEPDCSTARRSGPSGATSSTVPRRGSVIGASRCHASNTPRRSLKPSHFASRKATCLSGYIL